MPAHLCEAVMLAVSELVTNALVHGRLTDDEEIEIGVLPGRTRVRVWVAARGEPFTPPRDDNKRGRARRMGTVARGLSRTLVGRVAARTANGRLVRGIGRPLLALVGHPDSPRSQASSARIGAEGASDLGGVGAGAQLADLAVVLLGLPVDRVLQTLDHRLETLHPRREVVFMLRWSRPRSPGSRKLAQVPDHAGAPNSISGFLPPRPLRRRVLAALDRCGASEASHRP